MYTTLYLGKMQVDLINVPVSGSPFSTLIESSFPDCHEKCLVSRCMCPPHCLPYSRVHPRHKQAEKRLGRQLEFGVWKLGRTSRTLHASSRWVLTGIERELSPPMASCTTPHDILTQKNCKTLQIPFAPSPNASPRKRSLTPAFPVSSLRVP
ncbi:hypothetical protein VTK56DRAFT_9804 [Thermocarpiscus australiensis]